MMRNKSLWLLALGLGLSGCSGDDATEEQSTTPLPESGGWRYERGLTFVAREGDGLLAVPFAFRVLPQGEQHLREARAWLARGDAWDAFVNDQWTASPAAGVWRVLPHGDVRLGASSSGGIEWLSFSSGDRRLRLEMNEEAEGWYGAERERFRISSGTLRLATEAIGGSVVEEMRVTGRPDTADGGGVLDRIILLDREGLALYLLHERMETATDTVHRPSWVLARGMSQPSQDGRVRWVQVRPFEDARRDIPLHWAFAAPDARIHGEVTALGLDAFLGEEQGGRRGVEVHYNVEGWLERDGNRVEVVGIVRHEQR
jgi:hypothetical protein